MNDEENPNGTITESTPNIAMLNAGEVDMQITTAHRFPRSIKQFMQDALSLATLSDEVAESCSYALPRKSKVNGQWVTKNIEGPSARFAELVLSCWGNARAGTRIVDEGTEFVTAQGFMFDLQKNVAIEVNVPRRIVDSSGNRFKVDMIGVTANAAASIALRNAILKVVPKALWQPIYDKAKATALGTEATLSTKRLDAMAWFQKKGASAQTIFEHLGVKGIEDITLEHIATLQGYKTALKDGDTTVESLFSKDDPAAPAGKTVSLDAIKKAATEPAAPPPPAAAPAEPAKAADPLNLSGGPTFEELKKAISKSKTLELLAEWVAMIPSIADEAQRLGLQEAAEARRAELLKGTAK